MDRQALRSLNDTGIRVSELCSLRMGQLDHKKGGVTVLGKGSKERRIALGSNCLHNVALLPGSSSDTMPISYPTKEREARMSREIHMTKREDMEIPILG